MQHDRSTLIVLQVAALVIVPLILEISWSKQIFGLQSSADVLVESSAVAYAEPVESTTKDNVLQEERFTATGIEQQILGNTRVAFTGPDRHSKIPATVFTLSVASQTNHCASRFIVISANALSTARIISMGIF